MNGPAVGVDAHPRFKLGRRPGDPTRRALILGDYLAAVPTHPAAVDHQDHADLVFGLDGNDRWGDCGPTSVDNDARTVTAWLATAWRATLEEVLDLYRRSGNPAFDPATGADDNGVVLQTMLEALLSGGIGGRRPVAFARVDVHDRDRLRAAVALFGVVLFGVDLRTAQQTQTDSGYWDYAPSAEWGGHAVAAVGYDPTGIDVVTWGRLVHATDAFVEHQLGEAWVLVWPEHLGDARFLEGVDVAALAADYEALTGRAFPHVNPPAPVPPVPAPGPAPGPAPASVPAGPDLSGDPASVELATALHKSDWPHWQQGRPSRRAHTAALAWLAAHPELDHPN